MNTLENTVQASTAHVKFSLVKLITTFEEECFCNSDGTFKLHELE